MNNIPKNSTVIVIDTSNYKASYSESVPFKAKVKSIDREMITVQSFETSKEYELDYVQVLETMDIEDITKLIDLSKYGM